MASVRVLTNETIGVVASTNNYATFKMPAGNVSSISFELRSVTPANTVFSQFDGLAAAMKRVKITFDGQVVFDHTQFDATDTTDSYQVIDQIRTVLNGTGEKGVQYTLPYLTSADANYGTIDFPLMLTVGKEVNAQIVFDVNVESAYCDNDALTSLVGDVMVNYVDNLTGTYTTRSLSREASLSTSGTAIKQIPEVSGYALEALILNSTSSGVAKVQFGASSRISLRDLNGNVFLGERSGIEYSMLQEQKWGNIPDSGKTKAADITAFVPETPATALLGKIILDCMQMVGSAALFLSPDVTTDLDITAVYVQRNAAAAKPKEATQLATTQDSIGSGVTDNPAIS
jgi:hypothetical protein